MAAGSARSPVVVRGEAPFLGQFVDLAFAAARDGDTIVAHTLD